MIEGVAIAALLACYWVAGAVIEQLERINSKLEAIAKAVAK